MSDLNYDESLQVALLINNLRPELKAVLLQHLPFENIQAFTQKAKHVEEALKCCYGISTTSGVTCAKTNQNLSGNTQKVLTEVEADAPFLSNVAKVNEAISALAGNIQNVNRNFPNGRQFHNSRAPNRGPPQRYNSRPPNPQPPNRGRNPYRQSNTRYSSQGSGNFRGGGPRSPSPGRNFRDITCWQCGRTGHVQRQCWSRGSTNRQPSLNA